MPHLTRPLTRGEAVIEMLVTVSSLKGQALRAAGLPEPKPVVVRAVIDTGATGTVIDAGCLFLHDGKAQTFTLAF